MQPNSQGVVFVRARRRRSAVAAIFIISILIVAGVVVAIVFSVRGQSSVWAQNHVEFYAVKRSECDTFAQGYSAVETIILDGDGAYLYNDGTYKVISFVTKSATEAAEVAARCKGAVMTIGINVDKNSEYIAGKMFDVVYAQLKGLSDNTVTESAAIYNIENCLFGLYKIESDSDAINDAIEEIFSDFDTARSSTLTKQALWSFLIKSVFVYARACEYE